LCRPSDAKGGGEAADPAKNLFFCAGPSEQRALKRSAAALLRRPQNKILLQKNKILGAKLFFSVNKGFICKKFKLKE